MYDIAPKNAPWFEHLTDSVRALGHAADDWRIAAQAAVADYARADHPGLGPHEGRVVGVPGADAVGWRAKLHDVRPHAVAQRRLEKHYRDAMYATRHAYEDAARLYVSGAAWAVRRVQEGVQPERVEFVMTPGAGTLMRLVPGSDRVGTETLAGYGGAGEVEAAFQRLDGCLYAAQLAEGIDSQDYVADHEASAMHDALAVAEGIADAAYAYGQVLERALQFVLLGPRETHRKQLAQQAAEQESAGTEDGDG